MRITATERPLWYGREFTHSGLLNYISRHKIIRHTQIPKHRVPVCQIGLVKTGGLRVKLNGKAIYLPARHFIVIPAHTQMWSDAHMNVGCVYWAGVDLSAAEARDAVWKKQLRELRLLMRTLALQPLPANDELCRVVETAFEHVHARSRNVMQLEGAALGLVGELYRSLHERKNAANVAACDPSSTLIAPALRLIEARSSDSIKLTDLATACHLSRTTLNCLFKRSLGVSPHDYITRRRIEIACDRLRKRPKQRITQLAHELGFSSSQYFARAFRRLMGQSPQQFRVKA